MPRRSKRWSGGITLWTAVCGFGLGPALPALAQAPIPAGAQFEINSYTTGAQVDPSVAAESGGDFVVVWTSDGSSGSDTSGTSIQGRRYASGGAPRGAAFQVNSLTTGDQRFGRVASDAAGDFVVVWDSAGSFGTDTSSESIQAQRYASDGSPLGAQFQVNTYTTNSQYFPAVSMDADGDFAVAWASIGSPGSDSSGVSVQLQRFASDGTLQGAQVQVNTDTAGFQGSPSVAMEANGDFVVVWGDSYPPEILGRRFASDGSPAGAEFQVSNDGYYSVPQLSYPKTASDADGDFLVVWSRFYAAFPIIYSEHHIEGRRFASDGSPQGGVFRIDNYTTAGKRPPTVAMDAGGSFVVAWPSNGSPGTDNGSYSIQGRRFAADGSALSPQFQINSYTPNQQSNAGVSADAAGNFVVAWVSSGSAGADVSSYSIQGQRYRVTAAAPAVPAMSQTARFALSATLVLGTGCALRTRGAAARAPARSPSR